MELIKKYEKQKETIEALIKVEKKASTDVSELEKLNAVLRFIKEFINDLKRVNKFGVDEVVGFRHEHTEGVWTFEDFTYRVNEQLIKSKDKKTLIAIVNSELDVDRAEAVANAKLISNAPALLEIAEMYHDSKPKGIAGIVVNNVLKKIGVID